MTRRFRTSWAKRDESLAAVHAAAVPNRASTDLRRIAPTNIEGINLRGTFNFPVERYAQRMQRNRTAAGPL